MKIALIFVKEKSGKISQVAIILLTVNNMEVGIVQDWKLGE